MDDNQQYNQYGMQPFQDEETSNFDMLEWIYKVLNYWYLFVAAIIIALGVAYLKNRSWLPAYHTTGTVLIENQGTSSRYMDSENLMLQGFGLAQSYANIDNQLILLNSYDFLCQIIDSMPELSVDYITMGRFRTRNLYKSSPIEIESRRIEPEAYDYLFSIDLNADGTFEIGLEDNDDFRVQGKYAEWLETPYFEIMVLPTVNMVSERNMFFQFRSRESLVEDFSKRLSMQLVTEKSTVLSISLESQTPNRDKDFIDKMCELYIANNLAKKNDVANNTITFINEQLKFIASSLAVSEEALTGFRQENEIVSISNYASKLMEMVGRYDQEKLELRLRETYLAYITNYLNDKMSTSTVVVPSSLGVEDPLLVPLVQQLNELQLKRGEITEKNVFYARYSRDIENLKATIHEVVMNMQAALEIEKADLDQRFSEVRADISGLSAKEQEMVSIERNYRINDSYYTFFLQKRAEAEIQKASNTPDNSVLDKARTTEVTNLSAKSKTYVLAILIGILVPLIFVVLKEVLNNTVRTEKDLDAFTKWFPVLGVIRHSRIQDPVLVAKSPRSSFAEMFRNVRTRLEFAVCRKTDITILTTSAQSGDGKTYFSSNLAAMYALTGRKTVLIDMDIRKANLREQLLLPEGSGLTNYIIGDVTLDEIIRKDTGYDFDVITSGTIPPNPAELLRSDKLQEMFKELRQRYSYILIDTSPVGLVADAYAIMEYADVKLFILRSGETNKYFCRNILNQLHEDNMSNMYLLLNDLPVDGGSYYSYRSYGYRYGYGYGYGYGYYGSKKKKHGHSYYTDEESEV